MRWVKAKKRDKYHLVINNYYVCNKAIGKIYTKNAYKIEDKYYCKNCIRFFNKRIEGLKQ